MKQKEVLTKLNIHPKEEAAAAGSSWLIQTGKIIF
jgi:hypothetical protein